MRSRTRAMVLASLTLALQGCGVLNAEAQDRAFSKGDADVFVIRQGSATHRLKLNVTIAGWKVSCSRSRAVIWGQTRSDLPIGTPPYASVYILDVQLPKVIGELTTTRGPFDVDFTRDNRFIVVDENVIEFATGRVMSSELPPGFKVEPESCAEFLGKSLM